MYDVNVADDLNVCGAAMMLKVEPLDEAALSTNKFVKVDDIRHVVRESDDADSYRVGGDVKTERQSAREVHDEIVLSFNAA